MRKNFISALSAKALQNALFVDCRWSLKEPTTYGPAVYAQGHLPGAIFADVDRDLASEPTPQTGRHPLPPLPQFVSWLRSHGLAKGKPVVCYDDHGGSVAARLWWMLRCLGYPHVCLLDGGIQAWEKEGLPLDAAAPPAPPAPVEVEGLPPTWDQGHMPIVSVEQMVGNIGNKSSHVVDARPAPRFNSKDELVWPDPVTGHYPGALNWPWPDNLTADKTLRPIPELQALVAQTLATRPMSDVVLHCGSGVTACFNIAVAEELGLGVPKLYVGSWSEWCKLHPEKVERSK